jgi:hypothetical protein
MTKKLSKDFFSNTAAAQQGRRDLSEMRPEDEVQLALTRGQALAVEQLKDTGLFGLTEGDVIANLLNNELQRLKTEGWFYL